MKKEMPETAMMNRKLGRFETAQAMTDDCSPFNVVVALNLENGPVLQRVRKALESLQSIHPCLRVRIIKSKKNYYFAPMRTKSLPFFTLKRDNPDMWIRVAEEELNTRIDRETGPLFRCTCLTCSGAKEEAVTELIMTFHHAIADGPSGFHFLHQLLSMCTFRSQPSQSAGQEAGMLKPPAEFFYPSRFKGISGFLRVIQFLHRQMADEIHYRFKNKGKAPLIHLHAKSQIFPRVLSEKLTKEIVRFSRNHCLTLNNILSIAQLRTIQQMLHEKKEMPYRLFIFPNLRPYLIPPASDTDMASYFSMLRITFNMSNKEDFQSMALRFQDQVQRNLGKGEKYLSHFLSKSMMDWIIKKKDQRMGHSALSYTGPTNLARIYGDTTLRSIHAFVSNLGLGPELCAQARLFAGKIHLDFIYLDTDLDQATVASLADHMQCILENAVSPHPGVIK